MAGEGGEGPASEGEPVGGPQEEAGGAEAEGGETQNPAGGETEAETREEQGETDDWQASLRSRNNVFYPWETISNTDFNTDLVIWAFYQVLGGFVRCAL